MSTYRMTIKLLTDATFGRGDGVAGLVDEEIQHDELGCPYLGGKAIKGILVTECADILAALPEDDRKQEWIKAAERLFGRPGSRAEDSAILTIGPARLPEAVRQTLKNKNIPKEDTLAALTAIRWQTALEESGVTKEHSLRATRVIKRETPFTAELDFIEKPNPEDLALLSACILAFRRAGTSRNRGKGKLKAELLSPENKGVAYERFKDDYLKNRQEVTQ